MFLKPKQWHSLTAQKTNQQTNKQNSSKCLASEMCCTKYKLTMMSAAAWCRGEHYKWWQLHIKSAWWFAASLQRLQQPFHFQGEGVPNRSFRAQKLFTWVLSEIKIYRTILWLTTSCNVPNRCLKNMRVNLR